MLGKDVQNYSYCEHLLAICKIAALNDVFVQFLLSQPTNSVFPIEGKSNHRAFWRKARFHWKHIPDHRVVLIAGDHQNAAGDGRDINAAEATVQILFVA